MELTCRSKNKTGDSSHNDFKRLIANESKILELTEYIRFPGARQETPTMTQTFRGLQRLLMILGCRVATYYRDLMESTLTLQHPQSHWQWAQEPVEPILDEKCKGRKKDLEDLEILERRKTLQAQEMRNFKTWKELMDQGLKLQTKDQLKNLLFNTQYTPANALLYAPPSEPHPTSLQSISIGQVIRDLGLSYSQTDLITIGRITAKANSDACSNNKSVIGWAIVALALQGQGKSKEPSSCSRNMNSANGTR